MKKKLMLSIAVIM